MQFTQKTLKLFSYELLHDLEVSILDTFEAGVQGDWLKWLPITNAGILSRAGTTAERNKRAKDFSKFNDFKQNLGFADTVELIVSFSSNGNDYFKKFCKTPKEKNLLIQAIGEANRFRNLIDHPAGKTIYLTDIKEFIRAAHVLSNILGLSSLSVKYTSLGNDLENAIIESNHYVTDSFEAVYNNLPARDYEEWYGLVGRSDIQKEIIDDFERGHNRVVAITGGGGIGKSALALEICYKYLKPTNYLFKHIIWITSKNNFLDYSGINSLKPDYFYSNNYKDFLNQFISGFYQELRATDLDSISESELESEAIEILNTYNRVLCVVDNLENIDDPKILEFIKNRILPPNYVLITSRKGLGEINKTYKLEPLDDDSAFKLFENLSKFYSIDFARLNVKKIKELLSKTNNYPLVIKWCLSLVANKKMELEAAFSELNKPQNVLLEFIFQRLYKQLSKNSKKILRALGLYKEIPDRNIISYISELETEEELMDAIFELEQHSLIKQERIDSKNGIIETISLLGLAQTFINNITDIDRDLKEKYENKIIEIEQELDRISNEDNKDFRPAQKLSQSKLLQALKIVTEGLLNKKIAQSLIKEAERLAPRFYLIPFYKALIEMKSGEYEYGVVKQFFVESITINSEDPKVLFEYALLLKKHKRDSFKEYAPIFLKAFNLEQKVGYALEAGLAYFESKNFPAAYDVILRMRQIDPLFPRDNQHKLWSCNCIIKLSEMEVFVNTDKSRELLNSIEKSIDSLSQEKTKDYRLLKARFCSLYALIFALSSEAIKARELQIRSIELINIYRSIAKDRDSFELKELICYNLGVDALLSSSHQLKIEKLKKIEAEFNGNYKKSLLQKFSPLIRIVKKSIV